MGNVRCVFDGIVLRKKATEAPSTNDDLTIRADKMLANAFDIIHNLFERVRLGL